MNTKAETTQKIAKPKIKKGPEKEIKETNFKTLSISKRRGKNIRLLQFPTKHAINTIAGHH